MTVDTWKHMPVEDEFARAMARVDVLGPLLINGSVETVLSPMAARLLALLALNADVYLTNGRLRQGLWGDDPPRSASSTLQTYVCLIRRRLAALTNMSAERVSQEVLVTQGDAYALRTTWVTVDAVEAARLRHSGLAALQRGETEAAAEHLRASAGLRRAHPCTALGESLGHAPFVMALEESHLCTLQHLYEAEISLGRHRQVLPELSATSARHPYHEDLSYLLALGLYRSGRRQEALRTIADMRKRLTEELGLDLGSRLASLRQQILMGQ